MSDLTKDNKVAIITAASQGMGAACARTLARSEERRVGKECRL